MLQELSKTSEDHLRNIIKPLALPSTFEPPSKWYCRPCDKNFRNKGHLLRHQRTAKYCIQNFNTVNDSGAPVEEGTLKQLKPSLNVNPSGKALISCIHCGKNKYYTKDALKHLKTAHTDKLSDTKTMDYCTELLCRYRGSNRYIINSLKELSRKCSDRENDVRKQIPSLLSDPIMHGPSCDVCGKCFSTRANFWKHKRHGCRLNALASPAVQHKSKCSNAKPSTSINHIKPPNNDSNSDKTSPGSIYNCLYCDKMFSKVGNTVIHLKSAHRNKLSDKRTKHYCKELLSKYSVKRRTNTRNSLIAMSGLAPVNSSPVKPL